MPSKPTWLWPLWLCESVLHLLVGRQGAGKSTWAAWVVGMLTTGKAFPGEAPREPVNCAVLSLEEPDDRVRARLDATGADVNRVLILDNMEDYDKDGKPYRRPWRLPKDCEHLKDLLLERDIAFLVVDGLGFSIDGDSHNYANVGAALSALAGVAERTDCAILGLTHPAKGSSDPVTAAIGSTAWTALPRLVWVLGVDPTNDAGTDRVVRVSKTNYREPDKGVSFVIGDDGRFECGFVTNLGTSTVSAADLVAAVAPAGDRSAVEEIAELLTELTADGPITREDARRELELAGFSPYDKMLQRARRLAGVVTSKPTGFGGQRFYSRPNDGGPPLPVVGTPGTELPSVAPGNAAAGSSPSGGDGDSVEAGAPEAERPRREPTLSVVPALSDEPDDPLDAEALYRIAMGESVLA